MTSSARLADPKGLEGNVVDYLFERSLLPDRAHRPYLRSPTGDWTFRMLADRADRIGNALKALGVTSKVSAWLMCTDNMPSGTAMGLGDVLTMRGGKTVEMR